MLGRDAKTYEHANIVHVKSRVKFEPNFTQFGRKSELCPNLALFGVIFWHMLEIDATFWHFWPFTLLCKFTFVAIYALFLG